MVGAWPPECEERSRVEKVEFTMRRNEIVRRAVGLLFGAWLVLCGCTPGEEGAGATGDTEGERNARRSGEVSGDDPQEATAPPSSEPEGPDPRGKGEPAEAEKPAPGGGLFGSLERARQKARVRRARADLRVLKQAVMIHRLQNGVFPRESGWPDALRPLVADEKQLVDPWGHPYVYRRLGAGEFEILSFGADGKEGGEGSDADLSSRQR